MKLFAFGLGYSALAFIRRFGPPFEAIGGTVRSSARIAELSDLPIKPLLFGPEGTDTAIEDWILKADAMLISIPPGTSVDPVLARFGRKIASSGRKQTIIYLSTIGVYGDRGGEWVDETRAPTPLSERSRTRVQAERAWAAIGKDKEKNVHILRLAGIYGPGRNALVNLSKGTAKRIVKPEQVFNRIHVDDIAGAIAAALAYQGRNEVWNVSDDEPAPPQNVVTFAAELMGIEPPPEQTLEEADITPLARSFYAENKRAANAKLKHDFAMDLIYPTYREGLAALWDSGEGRF
jgi:dTDP-4-dehydrorhamnose reductase